MKKLKIQLSKERNEKGYYIYIERGVELKFTNKKKAEAFERKFRKVLEDNVRILININSQIYNIYNLHYIDLNPRTTRYIREQLIFFLKKQDYVFGNYSQGNGSIAFQSISYLFMCNENSLWELKTFAETHKNYGLNYQCKSLLKMHDELQKAYRRDLTTMNINTTYDKQNKLQLVKSLTA